MKLRGPKSQHTLLTQSLKLQSAIDLGIVCWLLMIQKSYYLIRKISCSMAERYLRYFMCMTTWKIKTIICVSSYLAIAYLLLLWSTSPSYFFILLSNCMLVRRMMATRQLRPRQFPMTSSNIPGENNNMLRHRNKSGYYFYRPPAASNLSFLCKLVH